MRAKRSVLGGQLSSKQRQHTAQHHTHSARSVLKLPHAAGSGPVSWLSLRNLPVRKAHSVQRGISISEQTAWLQHQVPLKRSAARFQVARVLSQTTGRAVCVSLHVHVLLQHKQWRGPLTAVSAWWWLPSQRAMCSSAHSLPDTVLSVGAVSSATKPQAACHLGPDTQGSACRRQHSTAHSVSRPTPAAALRAAVNTWLCVRRLLLRPDTSSSIPPASCCRHSSPDNIAVGITRYVVPGAVACYSHLALRSYL